jgi:hypothetical protein
MTPILAQFKSVAIHDVSDKFTLSDFAKQYIIETTFQCVAKQIENLIFCSFSFRCLNNVSSTISGNIIDISPDLRPIIKNSYKGLNVKYLILSETQISDAKMYLSGDNSAFYSSAFYCNGSAASYSIDFTLILDTEEQIGEV